VKRSVNASGAHVNQSCSLIGVMMRTCSCYKPVHCGP